MEVYFVEIGIYFREVYNKMFLKVVLRVSQLTEF